MLWREEEEMYHWESILAVSHLPQTQNNYWRKFGVLQLTGEYEFSSSAPGQPDDPS
jgi:hypothetical protein